MSKEQTALERIKDEVAKEKHYPGWTQLKIHNKPETVEEAYWPIVIERYARECCQATINEYKEKLKVDVKYIRNRTFKQDGMPVGENEDFIRGCEEILKLIDSIK